MEKDILNLIHNSIENDHCKILCALAMDEENEKMRAYYRRKIFVYSVIYDAEFLVRKLYEVHKQCKLREKDDDIDFAYAYYLSCKDMQTKELKRKLVGNYKKQRVQDNMSKLKDIKYEIKQIQKARDNMHINENVRNNCIVSYRATIVNMCMKYKILSEELGLRYNSQIDKIMDENVKKIIEEDKVYVEDVERRISWN